MKNFVRVPNSWYKLDENGESYIGKMGHKRFTMWFILNVHSTTMNMSKMIQGQITSTYEEWKDLTGFGKPANIKRMLLELQQANLIECSILNEKTKPSTLLNITLIEPGYSEGFQMIPVDLFYDKIKVLQPLGFYTYCFLFKNHNMNLGEGKSGDTGYAEYSSEFIGKVLNINKKSVLDSIENIKKARGLVKVIPHKHYHEEDDFGKHYIKTQPPRYIIWAKCDSGNEYYIEKG